MFVVLGSGKKNTAKSTHLCPPRWPCMTCAAVGGAVGDRAILCARDSTTTPGGTVNTSVSAGGGVCVGGGRVGHQVDHK